MAIAPMTESQIIDQIYAMYENDSDTWGSTSTEYLTARTIAKAAIRRWEFLEGTLWPELFTTLIEASDGTKTTTAGTYSYTAPTNMRIPPKPESYVRLVDANNSTVYYRVIPLSKVEQIGQSTDYVCYFTGNPKLGYALKLNPNLNVSTGLTINYEYYRDATYFTTTTSTTEMANPFFIVHYVLNRLYKSDGLLSEAGEELQIAEAFLQEMKADAQSIIEDTLSSDTDGFGYAGQL
jgi:hypothetical protein